MLQKVFVPSSHWRLKKHKPNKNGQGHVAHDNIFYLIVANNHYCSQPMEQALMH